MIMDDNEWKSLIKNIASGSHNQRRYVLEAAGYLWDSHNWERLSETKHGKFLRELDNDFADLGYRAELRKQVLSSQE